MAKKPNRPRKVFINNPSDIISLVELISEGKEEQTKAKVDRKKEILSRTNDAEPKKPRPRDLQLKEAKALAAARMKEKKKKNKDFKQAEESSGQNKKSEKPKGRDGRKKVSFG